MYDYNEVERTAFDRESLFNVSDDPSNRIRRRRSVFCGGSDPGSIQIDSGNPMMILRKPMGMSAEAARNIKN